MSAPGSILLRVFSGPHLGAEVVLPVGDHVLGADDSCDIILSDAGMAARHAVLSVALPQGDGPGAPPAVRIAPLDGGVRTDDAEAGAQGVPLAACTPCMLGETCIAWNRPGAEWGDVLALLRAPEVAAPVAASAAHASPDVTGTPGAPGASGALGDGAPDPAAGAGAVSPTSLQGGVSASADNVGGLALTPLTPLTPQTGSAPKRKGRSVIAAVLALVCASAIIITVETRPPGPEQRVAAVAEALRGAGLSGLGVSSGPEGVVVRGLLEGDAQRDALWSVARNLLYPVQIDVAIRDDVVQAVRAALNSRALYPEVTVMDAQQGGTQVSPEPLPGRNGEQAPSVTLRVAGYVRDGLVEAWAFNALREDVPRMPEIRRELRYASDVSAVLDGLLADAGLGHVRTRYLPGTVELSGELDVPQRERLDRVLDDAGKRLGVPVAFSVVRAAPAEQPAPPASRAGRGGQPVPHMPAPGPALFVPSAQSGQSAQADTALDTLDVRGVTMTPLRFITTGDGQRVFEGGMLPGGYVLETITTKELRLRKDGRFITHRLRGTHE